MSAASTNKSTIVFIVHKILDAYIFMCAEYVKTFIRECILLVSQLVNMIINLLLHIIHAPGHFNDNVTHKPEPLTPITPNDSNEHFVTATSILSSEPPLLFLDDSPKETNNRLQQVLQQTLDDDVNGWGSHLNGDASDEEEEEEEQDNLELKREFEEDNLSDLDCEMHQQVVTSQSFVGRIYNYALSVSMWWIMLIWYIPSLFKSPVKKDYSLVQVDQVHLHEKKSSGLLQDLTVALFQFTDAIAQSARLAIRLEGDRSWKQIKYAFGLFAPSSFLSKEGIDDRCVGQVIKDEGYPYEAHTCETQDGYLLLMDRIPNKTAKKVVYFQHGILDSGFAWVGNGVSHSLAFRAYDLKDVDVFLGNFRGHGLNPLHGQTTSKFNKRSYWDYSMNEHAFYDVRAFVEKIVEIKKKELNCSEDEFTICAVAHSMGAGSLMMYLVHSKLTNQKHHLSRAVLLSPAGNHQTIPKFLKALSYLMPLNLRIRLFTYFGFTSKTSKILVAKIAHDINSHPALRSLLAVGLSALVLGGPSHNSPFQFVHNLMYHVFTGTSAKVVNHFIQLNNNQKFQAYDYGSAEENAKHYNGSTTPWNFLEHYSEITPMIPVHVVMGENDRVIPPHNVMKHVTELQKHYSGDLVHVKKFTDCGHLELVLGCNPGIIKYVCSAIKLNDNNNSIKPLVRSAEDVQILNVNDSGVAQC